MEHIGYSLVDREGKELQFWGDTSGQLQGPPDTIRLPNGDDVHCPELSKDYGDVAIVPRWLQTGDTSSIVFDGQNVVVTRAAPPPETIEQKLESVGLSVSDLKTALGLS